jgi:P-type E1-E2 ATPase
VIVKGAGVIERLGEARSVLLDKTGTVTVGAPGVERVDSLDGLAGQELPRLAASLDQLSAHSIAEALVHEAQARRLELSFPEQVVEGRGQGIEGRVDGRRVAVGSPAWLHDRGYDGLTEALAALDRGANVLVGVEGRLAGAITMGDRLRDDARELVPALRRAGIRHVALATGDRASVAGRIGSALGVDRVYAEQAPEDKFELVRALRSRPELRPVVMVGDV